MTKDSLMELGLTEEQATKVMESLDGSYVTKTRFNEINTELKAAKATIKERDSQLEALKTSSGDVEALKQQITDLQAANAEQKKAQEAELLELKKGFALDSALSAANAINPMTVKPLLAAFMEKAKLAEDGSIEGLTGEIEKLVKGETTGFLFRQSASGISGAAPAGTPAPAPGRKSPKDMSYDELCAYLADNPGAALN